MSRVGVCINKKNRSCRFFLFSGGEEFVCFLYIQTHLLSACRKHPPFWASREQYLPQHLTNKMPISGVMFCFIVAGSVSSSSATAFTIMSRPVAVPTTLFSRYIDRTPTSKDFICFTIFYNNLSVSGNEIRNFLSLLFIIPYFIPLKPCIVYILKCPDMP